MWESRSKRGREQTEFAAPACETLAVNGSNGETLPTQPDGRVNSRAVSDHMKS
jgi:hypothetical protein